VEVTAAAIRALVERPTNDAPVTSVYLNTDGAQLPRRADYEERLDGLLRQVRTTADGLDDEWQKAVYADADAIWQWVREEFDREGNDVRGLGLFASGGQVFEDVQVALGVRNLTRVDDTPYVVPLEVLLGRQHNIGLVIIERDQGRIFRYRLGQLEEHYGLRSDVHQQHRRGVAGERWTRNIEHEVLHHMKDAAGVLFKAHEEEPFDALVVAGPHAEAAELCRTLHPYLQEVLRDELVQLPLEAERDELKARLAEVEQDLVSARRRHLLDRLAAAQGQAEKAARGVRHVTESVNEGRVEVLFVVEGAGVPGFRSATGMLALNREEAEAYGGPAEPVDDVIDELIEAAVKGGARIEMFRDETRLDGHPVAALLRF
jgi:peptide subunit release factor 1 (eRF1)